MTFIHFVNCTALTFGPLFVIYRAKNLRELRPILLAGLFHFLSQFAKLFLLATFVPSATDGEGEDFSWAQELMIGYISVVDLALLYLLLNNRLIRGNQHAQALFIGLGWSGAESLLERLVPLWIGARAVEFSWDYLLLALGSSVSVFYFYSMARVVWLWTRGDLPSSSNTLVVPIMVLSCLLPMVYKYLEAVMDFGGMAMLAVRVCVTAVMFVVSGVLLSDYEKRKQKTR